MTEPAAPAPPLSELDRLTGVLFDPKPAFTDIAARPQGWWLPLVLLIVLSLVFTYAFTQRVGWERFMRQQMESNPRVQDLPADRREQIIEQQARLAPIFGYAGSVVFSSLLALVIAGALLFVFNVLLGAELPFRQLFTLASYSLLPLAVRGVVGLAVLFLKDPADFDLENPVASNLGAFLDPNTVPKWLVSLGTSLDAFNVWVVLLLATGVAAAARKLSWSKSITWVVASWGLFLAGKSLVVWIFS